MQFSATPRAGATDNRTIYTRTVYSMYVVEKTGAPTRWSTMPISWPRRQAHTHMYKPHVHAHRAQMRTHEVHARTHAHTHAQNHASTHLTHARTHTHTQERTGRIGSRQQLAENVWLVSLGCSGGVQRYCGVHLYIIQHGFKGKPLF